MFQHLASCIHRYCTHDLKEPFDVAIALESCWIATISGKIGSYIVTIIFGLMCQLLASRDYNVVHMHTCPLHLVPRRTTSTDQLPPTQPLISGFFPSFGLSQ